MVENAQLMMGVAAGLMLSVLIRWGPTWRQLLAAIATASLIDFAINHARRALHLAGNTAMPSGEFPIYPHACPCIALTFIGVLAVIHIMRAG
jgi:hypothetical protein